MKLTKLQRYTMYCILLAESETPTFMAHPEYDGGRRMTNENGLCFMTLMITGLADSYDIDNWLPELGKFNSSNWWNNYYHKSRKAAYLPRIAALKACIEETHP